MPSNKRNYKPSYKDKRNKPVKAFERSECGSALSSCQLRFGLSTVARSTRHHGDMHMERVREGLGWEPLGACAARHDMTALHTCILKPQVFRWSPDCYFNMDCSLESSFPIHPFCVRTTLGSSSNKLLIHYP